MRLIVIMGILTAALFAEKKVVRPEGQPASASPLSAAISTDDFVYVSGMVGNLPGAPVDVKAQTKVTLDRVGGALKAAGLGFEHVISTTVYVADIRTLVQADDVYKQVFSSNPPARTVIEAHLMSPDAVVEISAVAVRDLSKKKILKPEGWPAPKGPFSYGVEAGGTIHVSGMPPVDMATGEIPAWEIAPQMDQAMANVAAVLKTAGAVLDDLVVVRNYLSDPAFINDMNAAYRKHFKLDPPTRATMLGFPVDPSHLIQMQTVAVRGASAGKKPIPANAVLSGSIMAGGKLYISGMTGRGPNGTPKNDIKAQTKFTFDRIKAELEKHGMTFADVVDSVVWLRDARHFQDMNAVYREVVTPNPPARATLRMPAVAADVLVEIMMVASK